MQNWRETKMESDRVTENKSDANKIRPDRRL